jgi:nitrogen regulatory protein PII
MVIDPGMMDIEQIVIIVNNGMGSKIMHTAMHNGISGGTVLLGQGTVKNRLLEFIGLSEERKEIILMIAEKKTARHVLLKLDDEFDFEKPNHGIAFTMGVCSLAGMCSCRNNDQKEEGDEDNNMYNAITVIVDKGKAEYVIDAATKAGSKGGTIINARGSGIHETSKLFDMEIEPEKEMVLIIAEKDNTEAIVESIRKELKIDEPGMGILYVQDVNKTYGLYK